jgi:hypothetical protein
MTTKNRTGSKHAAANALGSLDDRVRQLQSLIPGPDGGGSVATPFTIGGYTFGVGDQIDLDVLASISASGKMTYTPTISMSDVGGGGSTSGWFSIDYNRMVDFECITILGTSPVVTPTGPTWTIPLAPDTNEYLHAIGNSVGYDATGALQDFRTILLSGMLVEPRFTTTTPSLGQITASAPITWAVNDRFYIRGRYRASETAA